jgi:hypothetical protein
LEIIKENQDEIDNTQKVNNTNKDYPVNIQNPTYRDLEEMNFKELLIYEKRSFFKYFWVYWTSEHILLAIFLNKSLRIPIFIRTTLLIISIILDFAFNAFFYSDEYISKRAEYNNSNGSANSATYILSHELPKTIFSSMTSIMIMFIIQLFTIPSKKVDNELTSELIKRNIYQSKLA